MFRSRNGCRELLGDLVRAGHSLGTSALNLAEVFAGMRPEDETRTEAFLSALECYELTRTAGRMPGHLKNRWARKGRILTFADAILAAIALEQGCTLVTDNRKDFPLPELAQYPLREE